MNSHAKKTLTAKDVMTKDPVCAEPGMSIRNLARLFDEYEISGAPVVDSGGRLVGVVSKSDLLRRASDPEFAVEPTYIFEALRGEEDEQDDDRDLAEPSAVVEDFMTEDPVTGTGEDSLHALARRMTDAHIHRVIIISAERKPVGIVTSLDLLKALAE